MLSVVARIPRVCVCVCLMVRLYDVSYVTRAACVDHRMMIKTRIMAFSAHVMGVLALSFVLL